MWPGRPVIGTVTRSASISRGISTSGACPSLRRERPRELVEGALRAVLLWDVIDMGEAARERHARHMHRRHLRREHCLELIARLDSLDDREHEISSFFGVFWKSSG
jgi:hypothetical protein